MGESQRLTEDFVRTAVENYNALSDRIKTVAIAMSHLRGNTRNPDDDYKGFEFDEWENRKFLNANFEYYCCGGTESDCFEVPLEYLWTENFAEIEKARLEAEKEKARLAEEAKRVADEARKATEREERDKRDWERLRKRFGS
jgi:hypothetical protein